MGQTAKLFMNGRSQAVRLPAEFRFEGKEVWIRKDPSNGNIILSSRPDSWDSFFASLKGLEVPEDFLSPAERNQTPIKDYDPFEGGME